MLQYRGRFAPTPSGALHLGSLLTAVASFLEARRHRGQWLLRIDDLDAARCPPGADAEIRRQLEAHGLHWDGAVRVQSGHVDEYLAALEMLRQRGALYACACTRAVLARDSHPGPDGPVYAGACRGAGLRRTRLALRLAVPAEKLCIDDGWQGRHCRELVRDIGDFIVRRADGLVAYQLACAVDEHEQAITEVVRGADLLSSTFRQLQVLRTLNWPAPAYRHLPVLVGADGRKLSKQNHAAPVNIAEAAANLSRCLALLGYAPPSALCGAAPSQILEWAAAQPSPPVRAIAEMPYSPEGHPL
jgi:glutamyl-Q tRNA(Asp) synthetase